MAGTQQEETGADAEAKEKCWFSLRTSSVYFLIEQRTICTRTVPLTMGWTFPDQS